MRKYQPIWDSIKTTGTARLAAPVDRHRQIILAVRKEKTYDLAWKLENLEEDRKYKLLHKVEGKVLTFSLERVSTISYANLTPNDL